MAMGGEPIRVVRPRVIYIQRAMTNLGSTGDGPLRYVRQWPDVQRATNMGETGSSNEGPLRYVRQWPEIHLAD
eukprot:5562627-Heterocapsa_arctica.AAC.1